MKYQIILRNLKNGIPILESLIFDHEPRPEDVETCRVVYGAEKADIRVLGEETP